MCRGPAFLWGVGGVSFSPVWRITGLFRRTLFACMIHVVFPLQKDLGNGDDLISGGLEKFQDRRQCLGRVECSVVEQADGAGLDLAGDPLGDFLGGEILPVQTVPVGSSWKVFRCIVVKPKFVCVVLHGSGSQHSNFLQCS